MAIVGLLLFAALVVGIFVPGAWLFVVPLLLASCVLAGWYIWVRSEVRNFRDEWRRQFGKPEPPREPWGEVR